MVLRIVWIDGMADKAPLSVFDPLLVPIKPVFVAVVVDPVNFSRGVCLLTKQAACVDELCVLIGVEHIEDEGSMPGTADKGDYGILKRAVHDR